MAAAISGNPANAAVDCSRMVKASTELEGKEEVPTVIGTANPALLSCSAEFIERVQVVLGFSHLKYTDSANIILSGRRLGFSSVKAPRNTNSYHTLF